MAFHHANDLKVVIATAELRLRVEFDVVVRTPAFFLRVVVS